MEWWDINIGVPQSFCMCYSGIMLQFPSDSTGNYQQDAAKRQTAGIKFTQAKNQFFFAPQGQLVAPIHVKLGRADGYVGLLGCAKFHFNRYRGGNAAPKYHKFPLFGKESPQRGDSIDQFRNFLGAFIRPTIAHH